MKIAEMAVKCCTRNPKAHTAEECFNCEFKNGMCDSYKLAKILHEEGYEQANELKRQVADLNNRRHLIWAIGCDYDGCNTVESLKGLIDELVSYTQLPEDQVPDITAPMGRWVKVLTHKLIEEPDRIRWKCSSCGKETDLPNYEKASFCFNCGAKMRGENDD